ncbi:hypothetical protein [Bacillus stercoris]|uniref:hypothetical protein n=1 Tax=Bacillus stercoris TaxID=2054641 RepID=UPI002DB5A0C7|nr:hypothetical protein [Bacillus stercoris]MEC2111004.1 hypothetical protein [Bacillus stercoris]MEC3613833.1 hypothetical protein [Bacillus stercoris]
MAKSQAKKKREHRLRNGGRDVSSSRGSTPSFSTHERMTKSKKEILNKRKHKNPYDHTAVDDKDFFRPKKPPSILLYRFFLKRGIFLCFFHTIY